MFNFLWHLTMTTEMMTGVEAWADRAGELAGWVSRRAVVREDAHAVYYVDHEGKKRTCKQKDYETGGDVPVTQGLIDRHFRDNKIVGLYSTSVADRCLWLTIDIDQHGED